MPCGSAAPQYIHHGLAIAPADGKGRGAETAFWSRLLFHLGLFAFVLGVLSQAISLYQMMGVIERVGGASPAIVMGGLRVSLIAPFYGIGIFLAAMLFRFALEGMGRTATR